MHDYDDPTWGPLPVRPAALRWLLLLPLTLVFLPPWWMVWVVLAIGFYCMAPVAQLIVYMVPRAENGAIRMLDATLGQIPFVPLWCVTPVALAREGDTAYYQARVDRRIEKQTRRVETSRYRREYHRDLELGAHYFRGAGAGYALRVASEQGWNLHPVLRSHPRRRLRLRHNGRPRPDLRAG
ncbi:hypothetical protein Sme01_57430 [Sphaerisporangium melleum]|uniref:Uncharacterized protein n=1 Tax=Sphaerisporangium melleum TaxID=321316 RepID=A0A917VLZ7_9ACTN|nr:hypothetical protein [Sphaerisporangium melleum]GGK94624.1 hypothetical protein GCM10007964_41310 [Sphaerisporangium melleum]GII73267.1 hypothetical protein Sme01_57430 [Sphaerisporangium melleum]